LNKQQILDLLANFVPSARIAELIERNGIDFEPDEEFLQAIETAGAGSADRRVGGPRLLMGKSAQRSVF
jgi:hypothetical protein